MTTRHRLGVPVAVAVDTPAARDLLARVVAGCGCPRSAVQLHGWPGTAALGVVNHLEACDPKERREPRLVVIQAPSGSSPAEQTPSRAW